MVDVVRIATRKSPLALWQSRFVADQLVAAHPGLEVRLVEMSTRGDRILDAPLARVGGKALFVKELEQAMLEDKADIAVHSTKDVPVELPDGLTFPVVLERHDPRDALVANHFASLDQLPEGAHVGTSSLRRQCQLRAIRPDLRISDLRGNVGTRLGKLDAGDYDAIILAAAGLIRMDMQDRITEYLAPEVSLPAIAQGAIGIECRAGDPSIEQLIHPLHDADTGLRVVAERAFNKRLNGGCQAPIAGYAEISGDQLRMRGMVGRVDGSEIVGGERTDACTHAEQVGTLLAEDLLARGAKDILDELLHAETGD